MLKEILSDILTAIDNRHLPVVIQDTARYRSSVVRRLVQKRGPTGAVEYVPVDVAPVSFSKLATQIVEHDFTDLDSLVAYLSADTMRRSAFLTPSNVLKVFVNNAHESGAVRLTLPFHEKWEKWSRLPGTYDHESLCDFLLDNKADITDPSVVPLITRISMSRTVEFDADAESGDRAVRITNGTKGQVVENAAVPTKFLVAVPVFTRAWPAGAEPVQALEVRIRVIRSGDAPAFKVTLGDADKALEAGRRDLVSAIRVRFAELAAPEVRYPAAEGQIGAVMKNAVPAPTLYLGTPSCENFDVREEDVESTKPTTF